MSDPTNSSVSLDTNISFITSGKGQRLLIMNENAYRCNKKTAKKKYWRCVVSGCTMSVHTNENDIYVCGGKDSHDHESNSDMINRTRLRQRMKERVLKELTPINMIYEEEIAKSSLSDTTLSTFPTQQEICK